MSGTLTFYQNYIPKVGETVYIVVEGKSFPTGCYKGILTWIGDVGKSRLVTHKKIVENHTMCTAHIIDDKYPDCEPDGPYEVFPDAPGLELVIKKLNDQKAEVKALKKRIEKEKTISLGTFVFGSDFNMEFVEKCLADRKETNKKLSEFAERLEKLVQD